MSTLSQIDRIRESISEQVIDVLTSETYRTWASAQRIGAGDSVVLNNSFYYRDGIANRTKSNKYLWVAIDQDGKPSVDIRIALSNQRVLRRFKRLRSRDINEFQLVALRESIESEVGQLGTMVFSIVGRIGDDLPVSVELPDKYEVNILTYNPTQREPVVIQAPELSINRLDDVDAVWRAVERGITEIGITDTEQFSGSFAKSFENLREEAGRPVYIDEIDQAHPSILSEITKRLDEQISAYRDALDAYLGNARNNDALNELLRLAYNFVEAATALVTLVVGISDMKPLLCWLTTSAQFELTERFGNLPFGLVGKTSPSLAEYRTVIAGARNRVFHDIFAFGRPFHVRLTGDAFRDAELRLFQEFSKKSRPGLDYRDRELVELLTGFTRATERPVPLGFWEGNLEVMQAVLEVARSLQRALLLVAPPRTPRAGI